MPITPPVAVPLLIAAAVIAFALLRPPGKEPDHVRLTVTLPAELYRSLSSQVQGRLDSEGRPLTVARWLADGAKRDAAP